MQHLLTVITPVAKMAGGLDSLRTWIDEALKTDQIKIVLIHDDWDKQTGLELQEIVKKFSNTNLSFQEGTYRSPGLARNQGMTNIDTPFTIFWDSDDFPNIVETISVLSNQDLSQKEVHVCRYKVRDTANQTVTGSKSWSRISIYNCAQMAYSPGLWRMIIPTSALKNLEFTDCMMGEDQLFVLQVRNFGFKFKFHNETIYEYVKGREGQLTSSQSDLKFISVLTKFPQNISRGLDVYLISMIMLTRISFTALKHERDARLIIRQLYFTRLRALSKQFIRNILTR